MELAAHLAAIRGDGDLLAATDPADLELIVPGCPAWTVAQLLGHTGWVHRYVTATLLASPGPAPSPKTIEQPPSEARAAPAWYRDALDTMLDGFEQIDPDAPCSTFTGPQTARWWARRMAHETSVHRWDAQSASGSPAPIGTELGVDGVDEALDVYVVARFDLDAFGVGSQDQARSLHLHATDGPGEWMLTMRPDGLSWDRSHGKGDAAIRGAAGDLQLFLMSRLAADAPGHFEVFGDVALPDRWQAAATF